MSEAYLSSTGVTGSASISSSWHRPNKRIPSPSLNNLQHAPKSTHSGSRQENCGKAATIATRYLCGKVRRYFTIPAQPANRYLSKTVYFKCEWPAS